MNEEVLAGIKLLVALAKADGHLHENEEAAIKNAMGKDFSWASSAKEYVRVFERAKQSRAG